MWLPPGTWLHDRTVTKKGDVVDNDFRLCAPLEVVGKTDTRDLEHGRLVKFTTSRGADRYHILPMRLFAGRGEEALGELLSLGLETVRRHHVDILQYIQESRPTEHWTAALRTGWERDDAFVLPHGVIKLTGHGERIWYGGRDSENPYKQAGTLADWRSGVAALAEGNPNLIGTICAGLAGPLLLKFAVHGALINLYGPSSQGKTTCLSAGASVWGDGTVGAKNSFMRSWQTTAVGFEAVAALHSDTLAVVDELHLCDPKVLDNAIYAFANGAGKNRGNVNAGLRPTKTWRVMGLSSGEMSSTAWLRAGGFQIRPGQSVRMLDIPVVGKFGAFDDLHGYADGKDFAASLARNIGKHYGHAGRPSSAR